MDVTWKRAQGHGCHLGDPILPDLKLGAVGLAGSGPLVLQWLTAAGIRYPSGFPNLLLLPQQNRRFKKGS